MRHARSPHLANGREVTNPSLAHRLANEPDFVLADLKVSPSTGRVLAPDREMRVEALAMAVLICLVRARGSTVTRDALVDACWQGRIVTDDAIARAIAKVRVLERSSTPPPFTLETVPKIGYRLLQAGSALSPEPSHAARRLRLDWSSAFALLAVGIGGAGLVIVMSLITATSPAASPPAQLGPPRAFYSQDVLDALLTLDEDRLKIYLGQGWDPNWKLDSEGNEALHQLMMVCERNPDHDHEMLVRVARRLVEAGAEPRTANKWNDTPLIIAETPRYCGPDHPVVRYLEQAVAQ